MNTKPLAVTAKAIAAVAFVAVLFIIGGKGMGTVPWKPPAAPVSYSTEDNDLTLQVVLLPDSRAIIWHEGGNTDFSEGSLVRFSGYVGWHYFSRFWSVNSNGGDIGPSLFGLRFLPEGTIPAALDTEVLAHFARGNGQQTLPNTGDKVSTQTVLISDDALVFQGLMLDKDDVTAKELQDDIDTMLGLLTKKGQEPKA